MLDMPSFRHIVELVGLYYATPMELPANAGFATALGALTLAETTH